MAGHVTGHVSGGRPPASSSRLLPPARSMQRRLLLLIPVYLPQPFHVAGREGGGGGGGTLARVNAGKRRPDFFSSSQGFDLRIEVKMSLFAVPPI